MRRARRLFAHVVDPEHLARAVRLSARGKRRRPDIAAFLFRAEEEVNALEAALVEGTWRPSPVERIRIRDPKPRVIARAPFRDRVVHTALVEAMKPALMRTLRPECMACLPGRGTQRAVLHLLELRRRHRYALHLDVRAYFPTIDLDILQRLLAHRIDDPAFLEVMGTVLEAGALGNDPRVLGWLHLAPSGERRGLPVGAYTSQVLASWLYLDAFDHYVTRSLPVPGYLRYVDDLFLFADSRQALRQARQETAAWLLDARGLRLKWPHAPVIPRRQPLHALGYVLDADGVRPLARTLRRLRQRGRRYVFEEGMSRARMARSLAATIGLFLP